MKNSLTLAFFLIFFLMTSVFTASAVKTKKVFVWNYENQTFTLELWLENHLNYVQPSVNQPEPNYYASFLVTKPNDLSVNDVARKLDSLAKWQKFTSDQLLKLDASFVQHCIVSIKGDGRALPPKFPYQTLLDGFGDCEDKSLLCYAIMDKQGYKVALARFPSHLAVGVGCSPDLSEKDSGFTYLETTGFDLIGHLPHSNSIDLTFILPSSGKKIFHFS